MIFYYVYYDNAILIYHNLKNKNNHHTAFKVLTLSLAYDIVFTLWIEVFIIKNQPVYFEHCKLNNRMFDMLFYIHMFHLHGSFCFLFKKNSCFAYLIC